MNVPTKKSGGGGGGELCRRNSQDSVSPLSSDLPKIKVGWLGGGRGGGGEGFKAGSKRSFYGVPG